MKGISIRKQYPNLSVLLENELAKELSTEELAPLNMNFMQDAIKIRPSLLTKQEIDTRIEIIALRIGKVFRKMKEATCL